MRRKSGVLVWGFGAFLRDDSYLSQEETESLTGDVSRSESRRPLISMLAIGDFFAPEAVPPRAALLFLETFSA